MFTAASTAPHIGHRIDPCTDRTHTRAGIQAEAGLPCRQIPSIDADIQRCQAILITQMAARQECQVDLDKKLTEYVGPLGPLV